MNRIVIDQGQPPKAAVLLRELGWGAVHVREIGMHESEDAEIRDRAARESLVVITPGTRVRVLPLR